MHTIGDRNLGAGNDEIHHKQAKTRMRHYGRTQSHRPNAMGGGNGEHSGKCRRMYSKGFDLAIKQNRHKNLGDSCAC